MPMAHVARPPHMGLMPATRQGTRSPVPVVAIMRTQAGGFRLSTTFSSTVLCSTSIVVARGTWVVARVDGKKATNGQEEGAERALVVTGAVI